jgi:hypothetical protein
MTTRGLAGSTHGLPVRLVTATSAPRLPAAPPHSDASAWTSSAVHGRLPVAAEGEGLDAGEAVTAGDDGALDGDAATDWLGAALWGGVEDDGPQAATRQAITPRSATDFAMTHPC